MKVGVTGHQKRDGMDWNWVRNTLRSALLESQGPVSAYGSLAEGSDQVFAEVALECGAELYTVIPKPDYIKNYSGAARTKYLTLLSRSHRIDLDLDISDEDAFLAAGQRIVDTVDKLYAVWDGKPARGKGGTADIVDYAKREGVPVIHLDPINRKVSHI